MEYAIHLLTLLCIYVALSISLDFLIGHVGIMSFGHAAFFGVGAYTTAILTVAAEWNWLPAMIGAFVIAMILALVIGIPTLRLGGDYFILSLFGFQSIILTVILNWESLTNGPFGIRNIPRPSIGNWMISSGWEMLGFSLLVTAIIVFIHRRLLTSPMRAMLHSVRDDDTVAQSLGIDVVKVRIVMFALAGGFAGIAGSLLAFYFRFIEPTGFSLNTMILLWAMVFIGGSQSIWGMIVGPTILILFPETFRFMGISGATIGHIQQAMYGLLLILLMIYRPNGLVGQRPPTNV